MDHEIAYPLLIPALVLILWTFAVMTLMGARRFRGMARLGLTRGNVPAGGRGQDLDKVLAPRETWPSHNYTHLHEQPTLFYAVVAYLAILGGGGSIPLYFAWAYVVIRILHSIWQVTVNTIPVRFALFIAANVALLGLFGCTAITLWIVQP